MPAPAGFQDFSLEDSNKRFLKTGNFMSPIGSALLEGGQTSDESPDWRHPPGSVLVYKAADEKFVLADDATGDRNDAAEVTALETADDDWEDKDITIEGHWGSKVISLAASDDTDNEVRDAINTALAAAGLDAHVVASVANNRVVLTNKAAGKGTWLKVTHEEASAFGADGTSDAGH